MNGDKKTNGFLLFDIHDSMYFMDLNGEFNKFIAQMRKSNTCTNIYFKIVKSKHMEVCIAFIFFLATIISM